MRMLVIEDEKHLVAALTRGLDVECYSVDVALDGRTPATVTTNGIELTKPAGPNADPRADGLGIPRARRAGPYRPSNHSHTASTALATSIDWDGALCDA